MASIIKRLWSGSDFWDKEENKQQRQQYAAPRPQPEMEQKIKTARYGVLANNPQRQQQFIQDTKPTPGPSILSTVHNTINDTLNANTQADQQRRLSQGLPRYYQDQSNLSKITRAAETGGRVTARVLQGIGQDTLGAYDLLTPGHGTNRATKYYQNRGKETDQEVKDMGLDENVYKAGQVPLALGSYMIPGKAVSSAAKATQIAKVPQVVKLAGTLNKVPGVTKTIGALDDLAANGTRLERVASRLARSYTRPGNIADVGVDALQNAGHRTSLGQDNSAGTLALDVGMSLGMQGGMNLAGQGASAGIRAANAGIVQPTTRLVRNVTNTVAPVQTTTKLIPRTGRLDLATSDALKAYNNMLVGADPNIQGKVQSDLIARIQQIGKENGVDLTNGSVEQRMARVEAMLNGYLPQTQTGRQFVGKPLGEGGYIKNPLYDNPDTKILRDSYDRSQQLISGKGKKFTVAEAKQLIEQLEKNKSGLPMGWGDNKFVNWTPKQIADALNDPMSNRGRELQKFLDRKIDGKVTFGAEERINQLDNQLDELEKNPGENYKTEVDRLIDEKKALEDINQDPYVNEYRNYVKDNADLIEQGDPRVLDEAVKLREIAEEHRMNIDEDLVDDLPETRLLEGEIKAGELNRTFATSKNQGNLLEAKQTTKPKSDPLKPNTPVNKRMSDVDSSERGNLNQYKATKKVQYEQLKELKRQYKEGNIVTKGNLRVPLMMARSKYQETLAAIKNAEKIIDSRAKELGQTTKLSKSADPLESLKQEARTVYRGGKPFDKKLVGSDGTSFSTDKAIADRWRGSYKGGVTEEFQLAPDTKVFVAPKPEVPLGSLTDSDKFAVVADASRKGYDAVDMTSWGEKEIRVINAGKLTQPQPPKSTPFQKDLQAVGLAPSSQAKGSVGTPSRSTPKKPQRLEVPSGQTTELPRLRQSKANPANQPSNRNEVLSKETPVNAVDSTTNAPDSKDWGRMMLQADEETQFNAVAGAAGTKNATKLTEAINNDAKITKAAIEAQRTGKELNFFAKKDANDRSVGIEQFDPDTHRIEAGMVVDNKGNVVGNHIKVDETGIQVNVGGELVNMGKVLGKPDQWKGKYRVTETMSRNIDRNAPNKEIAQKAKDFLVGGKTKAEANYRTELDLEYKKLGNRIKTTNKAKPRGVSKQQWEEDIFDTLDGKKSDVDIRASYDKSAADAILNYKKETRTLYDSLLERINTERVKFGQAPVEGRKDYITHLSELAGNKSFAGEVYSSVRNSFTDEGMQKTRNGVPGEIAGRSENFKPLSAWNRFMQRRTGDKAVKDPFNAVQAYLEPALYNIHMTESTVRARAIESAFRTAGELQKMKQTDVAKIAGDVLKPYMNGDNGKLVAGFQEYANALAKKTQRWDRQIIDASDASATALKGWQGLQRVGGRATILGNVSSTLSQVLGQPIALADAGVGNYLKGVAKSLGGDNAILQSDFIKARKTKAVAPIRGKGQKILDAGGVPLEKVELASVELVWNTQHAKATAQGYTGKKAVQMADYNTERLVAGRGIADRPEAYRSTMSSGLLQYTLEVSAQNKAFWRDLSVSQKATFMVAALGANSLFGAVTGFKPLPDFLGAAIDTTKDFANTDDERSAGEKALGGVQRGASEAISMNPIASAFVNTALSQDQRRSLFGKDSGLGRFEGTAAPIQVIKNSYRAGKSALDGNLADARNSALKTVPFGNQIRKTWAGAEANARGYAVDRNGKKTFETGKNVYEQAQNLLFGTSSTKSAQAYYSGDSKKKTELRQIGTTTTKDEKGNYTARDKYDTLIDAYKKNKDGTIGVNDYDTNELRNTIKQVGGDLNKELKAAGLREIKADSRHAVDYAKYKKSLAGKDELEVEKLRKDFYRDTYMSQLDKRTQAFYKLGDDNMRDAIKSGKITKAQLDKAIETDNYLTEKGLQSYLQIGKTLRRELGYAAPGGKGMGGRKGRGGKRKAIPKDLMAKAMDVPKVAQLRQSKITAKQPQARSFKTRRKAIPKIAKSTPKLTVKRTQTA